VPTVAAVSAAPDERFPVRRNTILLAASLAALSGMLQLGAAIATLTFVAVTGIETLLGLAPALLLATAAVVALPAGRLMDQIGRIPVIAGGYVAGLAGTGLAALGAHADSSVAFVAGLLLIGAANGAVFLTRTAAGDMYPPERRARGISFVLFGSVFGAILGPAVFAPLFAGKEVELDTLALAWLVGGGFCVVGLVLVLLVRPDPKRIAERMAPSTTDVAAPPAPLGTICRRHGAVPALLAAVASFAVMVAVMNLTGYAVVHEHGHSQAAVFPIIGAHVLGMYALVLVVGSLIDRIGRGRSLGGGLVIMAVSCAGLVWAESVTVTAVLLFGLGLGWNLSFVAATAQLADLTSPVERGKLLGLSDLLSGLTGAGLAIVGGVALEGLGVAAMAIGAAAIAAAPVLWLTRRSGRKEAAVATIGDR